MENSTVKIKLRKCKEKIKSYGTKKTLKNYKGLKKKFIKEGVYEKKFSHLLNCYEIFHLKSYRYGV